MSALPLGRGAAMRRVGGNLLFAASSRRRWRHGLPALPPSRGKPILRVGPPFGDVGLDRRSRIGCRKRKAMMDDILIRGGQVIDGTGAPAGVADVAIRAGRIVAIEADRAESAGRVIDAHGSVVAPGFIDIHTHSDFTLPLNPKAEAKIRQGVTTEVVGNCGFSVAPALPGKVDALRQYLSGSAPWLTFEVTDFARYMDGWPDTAVNTVMQVGHNTLRLMAMGMENRAPREAELRHMQDMLAEGLEAGALGLSSGLFTAPGCFSERDELRALGRVLKAHG